MRLFRGIGILRVASTALACAVLLAACSATFTPPAAVVNGREISQATLESELALRLEQPQFAAQVRGPGGESAKKTLTRQLLSVLIQQQVIAGYALQRGITVSAAEVDRSIAGVIAQFGGRQAFDRALRERHLSMADYRRGTQQGLLDRKVQDRVLSRQGVPPTAPAAERDRAFVQWLRRQILASHIRVNPRFGRFDVTNVRIVPITSTAA